MNVTARCKNCGVVFTVSMLRDVEPGGARQLLENAHRAKSPACDVTYRAFEVSEGVAA